MKRSVELGGLAALFLLEACHRRSAPPPADVEGRGILATLAAGHATTLGARPAAKLERGANGLVPRFGAAERVAARVVLPLRASSPVHVEDLQTGASVGVSMRNVRDVAVGTVNADAVYAHAHASGATILRRVDAAGMEDFLGFDARPTDGQIAYDLTLGPGLAGLRLVSNTLELVDGGGTPRLRVEPPFIIGADGERSEATLAVDGCAVDTNPAAPWGRATTPPGAGTCSLRVRWADKGIVYPAVLDPRWTTTGTMVSARQDHAAIRLSTNKVLVAGGRTSGTSTTGLATAELFDPTTSTWAATGSMTAGGWSASATQLNTSSNSTTSGKVLVAGGINGTASVTTAQLYSASAGTWIAATSLNAARHLHTATLMPNGNVLVAGGMNGTTVLATAAIFNPTTGTGTWTAVSTNMATARRFHTATLLSSSNTSFNNKILIAGGNSGGTTSLTGAQLFDTSALTWSTTTALPSAREGQTATLLANGNVLVTGGKSGTTALATTLVFTIPASGTSATWPSAGTMTSARSSQTATLLASGVLNQGSVLVAGGSNGTSTLATAELWNGTSTWTATTALASPVQAQTATLLASGAVLLAGGINGSTTLNTGAAYDPSFALSCASNSQCATGFCVNGVCCDTACNNGCGACNLAGKVGTCSPVGNGMACPDDGNPCTTDTCNGTSTVCQHPAGNNGATCPDDGNPCTTDRCNGTSTTCQHAAGNNGTACPDDGNPCTVDRCDGVNTSCQHPAGNNGTACPDDGNPCTTDTCNGASTVCQHPAGNAGVTCRVAAGSCDVAEACTGTSTSCPADGFLPSTTVCRAAIGACDATETCTGASASCPADGFLPSTTVCRAAIGACDAPETCTGTSTSCPADGLLPPTTVCRAAAGECDLAETCSGTSTTCPSDSKKSSGTTCTDDGNACTKDQCDGTNVTCQHPAGNPGAVCRAAAGECDLAETCSGTSTTCPTDGKKSSGTTCTDDGNACTKDQCDGTNVTCQHPAGNPGAVCRAAAGECDLAETCSGTSTACPTDGKKSSGTTCTDDGNVCTTDQCDGTSATCQHPAGNAGTVCRTAAAECDVAEACTGTSTTCPTDGKKPSGTACTDDGNVCTKDQCDGTNVACQHPAGNAGTVCRTAAGECDLAEACTGTSTACPTDGKKPSGTACTDDGNVCTKDQCDGANATCQHAAGNAGTVCRAANGACDLAETCSGTSTSCPPDGFQPNATPCDDGNACTTGDSCNAGACTSGTAVTCTGADACHTSGACVPASGCPAPVAKADGTPCSDGNACTNGDSCQLGACVAGASVVCVASDTCHAPGVCEPQTGVCTNPPLGTGGCQVGDGFDYDKAGRLIRDHGALLAYDAYDQLRTVTPAPVAGPQLGPVRIEAIGDIGATQSFGRGGINQQGRVVGYAFMPSGRTHGFLTTGPGTTTDINVAANIAGDLTAYGINDAGTVTGMYSDGSGSTHPFRYNPATGLEDLGVANVSGVFDINTHNQLAGQIVLPDGTAQGFRYTDGLGFEEIGILPGGSQSYGWTIDPNGIVFGSSKVTGTPATTFAQFGRAVVFRDPVIGLQDLNDFIDPTSGLTLITANRVAGDWVGGTASSGGHFVGFRLKLGTGTVDAIRDPWAGDVFGYAVNSYGEAVGDGFIDAGNSQKALWFFSDQYGFVNLSSLVDAASGWSLQYAAGINDLGDVTGWGYLNGVATAYIMHLPLRQSTSGAPALAEAHTYGYDGLRTSTTTLPGTPSAHVQVWFTQDYNEHDGIREHYVRVGERLIAKVTTQPPPGGMAPGMASVSDSRRPRKDLGNLIAELLLGLVLTGGLGATVAGVLGRKRRPAWVAATAGPVTLFFVTSCEMFGANRRSAETAWQRIATVYFHRGIAPGPVLTTNSDGGLREERRYDPFGQPIDSNVGSATVPVDFRREAQNSLGKLTDPSTGWSYHGARWMQPQSARWTSPDSAIKGPSGGEIARPWHLNPYTYADQSPVDLWDPDGKTPKGYREIWLPKSGPDGAGENIWLIKPPEHTTKIPEGTIEYRPASGASHSEGVKGKEVHATGDKAVRTQLAGSGPGFIRGSADWAWGRAGTIDKIKRAAEMFDAATHGEYYFRIGGIGHYEGGSVTEHWSHDKGKDIDLTIVKTDTGRPINHMAKDDKTLSVLQQAVDAFWDSGGVETMHIYLNNPEVERREYKEKHEQHLHVRVSDEPIPFLDPNK